MRRTYKRVIKVEFDIVVASLEERRPEPDPKDPDEIAQLCLNAVVSAIESVSQASAAEAVRKGDASPKIPNGMPIDLVISPGTILSCKWKDLMEARELLNQPKEERG